MYWLLGRIPQTAWLVLAAMRKMLTFPAVARDIATRTVSGGNTLAEELASPRSDMKWVASVISGFIHLSAQDPGNGAARIVMLVRVAGGSTCRGHAN